MKKLNKVFYRTSATLVLAITMASSFSLTKASASEPKVVIQSNSNEQTNINEQTNTKQKPKLMLAVVATPVATPVAEEVTPPAAEEVTPPAAEGATPPAAEGATPPAAEGATPPAAEEVTPPAAEETTPPVTEEVVEEEEFTEVVEEEFTEVVYEEEFSGIIGQPNVDKENVKIQLAAVATKTPKNNEKQEVVIDQVTIASNESNAQNTNNSLTPVKAVASSTAVVGTKEQVVAKEEVKATPTIVTSNAVFLNEGMTSLPQTGENSNQLKVAGVMLLGALGALMALVLFQRRERQEEIN